MLIGVPKETKSEEYRVGLTPEGASALIKRGHAVCIEHDAGTAIGFTDADYLQVGAKVGDAFSADLVVKVKEPSLAECARFRPGQVLFTFLHLAAAQQQATALLASGCRALAYETVEDEFGSLPLLKPMSEIAGRMSIQVGATALQNVHGGRGILLGGAAGVAPGKVAILGGGVAGSHAAQMAVGLQANVTIVDRSLQRVGELTAEFAGKAQVLMASKENVTSVVRSADLVVGAVLIPGAAAPKLVDRRLLNQMKRGAVLVDIAIDQGGCFASSKATTHAEPTFIDSEVVHYCVANMPGGVARTATEALCRVTLSYILSIADQGLDQAMATDPGLARGLNVDNGRLVHPVVAAAVAQSVAA
ncbi:MAG: alanine dehydrogenase [Pseudomonadales bacterium]|nr:alanine dehydrogenase [Pseudomonadales bacterium]